MSLGAGRGGSARDPARYVWVEDDGSARELTRDEAEYIGTEFVPSDGGRPYIKSRYGSRTPDGRLSGFLARSALPAHVAVRAADDHGRDRGLPPQPRDRPRGPGRRTTRRMLTATVVVGATLLARVAWQRGARAQTAGGDPLGPGAAVVRGPARIAAIERVTRARGRGRLPLYLAPATGPVVDSARVGALAALLVRGAEAGNEPLVALVPRDSVAGLPLVGRLVVTPGEPGLLVFGARTGRP